MEGVFLCQSKQEHMLMRNSESCNYVNPENLVRELQQSSWVYLRLQCINGYANIVKEVHPVSML